jgi:hypothetical protein
MTDKPITPDWRFNCRQSLVSVGLAPEYFDALPVSQQDAICRLWATYVDAGVDFGTAALHVLTTIVSGWRPE